MHLMVLFVGQIYALEIWEVDEVTNIQVKKQKSLQNKKVSNRYNKTIRERSTTNIPICAIWE